MNSWTGGPRFRFLGIDCRALGISVGKGVADDSFLLAEGRITRVRKSAAARTQYWRASNPEETGRSIIHDVELIQCVRLVGLTNPTNGLRNKSKNQIKDICCNVFASINVCFRQQASQLLSLMGRQPASKHAE